MTGKLYLVSAGPGFSELIPPLAQRALEESEVIVAYELYLRWIQPWIVGKEICTLPLTQEKERAIRALEAARQGRTVSLVSSGDIGVYAMAALVLEEMREEDTFALQVIPGISAANSCASLLGSPLSHDFATLSLSDLLCPWEWIEHRARHIAQADLVVALYNVQSRARTEGVFQILRILLESKSPDTFCGVVRSAYREDESHYICTLAELLEKQFDMFTTIIVGNRFTRRKREFIYTPRGYNSWQTPEEQPVSNEPSVWVFSGTSDGNALATELAGNGYPIIVSTATEYGKELVLNNCRGVTIRAGRMGVEARRRELRKALLIVDATHPFATGISTQLMELAKELGIPYLRFERPVAPNRYPAIWCDNMDTAALEAIRRGRRIFLATGSKDLAGFLKHDAEWFVRIAPDPASMEKAIQLGVPRPNICAMQGPFTTELNEALWRSWKIDCVVTKESGEAGGFNAKAEAAANLSIPLLVVRRPVLNYPVIACDTVTALSLVSKLILLSYEK